MVSLCCCIMRSVPCSSKSSNQTHDGEKEKKRKIFFSKTFYYSSLYPLVGGTCSILLIKVAQNFCWHFAMMRTQTVNYVESPWAILFFGLLRLDAKIKPKTEKYILLPFLLCFRSHRTIFLCRFQISIIIRYFKR